MRALRYPVWVVIDVIHASGQWLHELYFPENGVVANVEREYASATGNWDAKLNAFYGEIRNHYHGYSPHQLFEEKIDEVQPTEDVEVSRELAERIFALAELHKRQTGERDALGPLAVGAGVLRTDVKGVVKDPPWYQGQ